MKISILINFVIFTVSPRVVPSCTNIGTNLFYTQLCSRYEKFLVVQQNHSGYIQCSHSVTESQSHRTTMSQNQSHGVIELNLQSQNVTEAQSYNVGEGACRRVTY